MIGKKTNRLSVICREGRTRGNPNGILWLPGSDAVRAPRILGQHAAVLRVLRHPPVRRQL